MDTNQIIAQAHQKIAERQIRERIPLGGSFWYWLLPVVALTFYGTFFVLPAPLSNKLLWAMGGVCGLRPAHSYFAGSIQLPLEARMLGIYGGFSMTFLTLLLQRRLGSRHLGTYPLIVLLGLFFSSMVFDGINSTLFTLQLPHLYQPTNLLRLITGLLAGIALAPVLLWLLSIFVMPETEIRQAVLQSPWDAMLMCFVNGGFAALVLSEHTWTYYPIALISVGGVVSSMTIVVLLVVLTLCRRQEWIAYRRYLLLPVSMAFLITWAILALTAALRWHGIGFIGQLPDVR